jgi:O-antigen/teichoic acid export membrane protein
VLTNWGAMAVQMVAGFIVPRLIDRNLSQEALGLWDLAWSFVVYFALIQIGVTSSINRYVAFHRTKGDFERVNQVVSSAAFIMRGMAAVVVVAAALSMWGIGHAFHTNLGNHVPVARWLVFLLGINVAVQISTTVYASVLTGCHRWDLHNGVQALTSALAVGGMVIALLMGQGLITLALVHLAGEAVGRLVRAVAAYRVCPWLEIRREHFRWTEARAMLAFGGKASASHVSQMVMNSTISLMIAAYLGPAALAFYSRPLSLMRNITVLINKYAMVFSPTISSLQAAGEDIAVRELAVKATRGGLYIALPGLVFLLVFGEEVLRVWMGPKYADPTLISLVVVAFIFQVAHVPLFKSLVGLNLHGQPGVVNVVTSLVTITAVYVVLSIAGGGLIEVAACLAVAMTLSNGVYLPLYACRKLGMPLRVFWQQVWRGPVVCAVPFAVCLVLARAVFSPSPGIAAVVGATAGSFVLAVCYWRAVLPDEWKQRLFSRFSLVWKPKHV